MSRPRRPSSARLALIAGFVLVAAVVALSSTPEVSKRVRLSAHARRLDSSDPAVRAAARAALVELGVTSGPVFAKLVASEVHDFLEKGDTIALVASRVHQYRNGVWYRRTDYGLESFLGSSRRVAARIEAAGGPQVAVRRWFAVFAAEAVDEKSVPLARRFFHDEAARELVVLGPPTHATKDFWLLLAIPLEGAEGVSLLEAVRDRLAQRPP